MLSSLTVFFFPCFNRGMKRKRAPAGHHRNEWVFIHSLGQACIVSSIAVRPWPRCCQWRPCQHLGQWRAPSIGTAFSQSSWTQQSLKLLDISLQHITAVVCIFFRIPASIWDPGFTLLMARGKWTTSSATNTKRDEAPSRAFPSHPMEASTYRCWRDWRRKESLRRSTPPSETWRTRGWARRRRLWWGRSSKPVCSRPGCRLSATKRCASIFCFRHAGLTDLFGSGPSLSDVTANPVIWTAARQVEDKTQTLDWSCRMWVHSN